MANFEIIHASVTAATAAGVLLLAWLRHRDAVRERQPTFELDLQPFADAPPYFLFRIGLIARNGGLDGLEVVSVRLKAPRAARFTPNGDSSLPEQRLRSGTRDWSFRRPFIVEPKASATLHLLAVHRVQSQRLGICSLKVTFIRRDKPTKTRRRTVKAKPRPPIEKPPLVITRGLPKWVPSRPDWLRRD